MAVFCYRSLCKHVGSQIRWHNALFFFPPFGSGLCVAFPVGHGAKHRLKLERVTADKRGLRWCHILRGDTGEAVLRKEGRKRWPSYVAAESWFGFKLDQKNMHIPVDLLLNIAQSVSGKPQNQHQQCFVYLKDSSVATVAALLLICTKHPT